jgi:hypothetical protein
MKCPSCKGEMEKDFDASGLPIVYCLTCNTERPDYSRRRRALK